MTNGINRLPMAEPMNKPLSETHPTFLCSKKDCDAAAVGFVDGEPNWWFCESHRDLDVDEIDFERAWFKLRPREMNDFRLGFHFGCKEVERLKKELANVQAERDEIAMVVGEEQFALGEVEGERRSAAEVERLKKELEDQKSIHVLLSDTDEDISKALEEVKAHKEAMILEGERRAMERVKALLDLRIKRSVCIDSAEDAIRVKAMVQYAKDLKEELGLGEEEKPIIYKCKCTLEQLEKRKCLCADNNNYTNTKGAE